MLNFNIFIYIFYLIWLPWILEWWFFGRYFDIIWYSILFDATLFLSIFSYDHLISLDLLFMNVVILVFLWFLIAPPLMDVYLSFIKGKTWIFRMLFEIYSFFLKITFVSFNYVHLFYNFLNDGPSFRPQKTCIFDFLITFLNPAWHPAWGSYTANPILSPSSNPARQIYTITDKNVK